MTSKIVQLLDTDDSSNNNKAEDEKSNACHREVAHLFVYASDKAGMESNDKEKIQKLIYNASKGSKYYENENRKAKIVDERINRVKEKLQQISSSRMSQLQKTFNKRILAAHTQRDCTRTWIHVDMDMFYAAVALRNNPHLKGKPVAVGGNSMISTTNYVARKYGVRAGMPGFIGKKLCPNLIFVKHEWKAIKEASEILRAIVADYDPNFTTGSLDEVYLDITQYLLNNEEKNGEMIANEIRSRIFKDTQLTASAGVACNRMLCKIGSDMNKPNGQFILQSNADCIQSFITQLSTRKIPGIGKVTQRILQAIGCKTCGDVLEKAAYVSIFFKPCTTEWLLRACNGISVNERDPNDIYTRKSISVERTFSDIKELFLLEEKCVEICKKLAFDINRHKIRGKTITLKLKTTDFEIRTRAHTLSFFTDDVDVITRYALEILRKEFPICCRLLGVRLSSLENESKIGRSQTQMSDYFSVVENGSKKNVNENNVNENYLNASAMGNHWNENQEQSLVISNQRINEEIGDKRKRKEIFLISENDGNNDQMSPLKKRKMNVNHQNQKHNKNMDLSQMFKAMKNKKKEKESDIYQCPICFKRCFSNFQLNVHLDHCISCEKKEKKTRIKNQNKLKSVQKRGKDIKSPKGTLSQYFKGLKE